MPYIQFSNPVSVQFRMWPAPSANLAKTLGKPLFTDNSLVYYKPGSLSAGGVGSVRNIGVKSRRI